MSLDAYIIGIPALLGGIAGALISPYGDEKEAVVAGRHAFQEQKSFNENNPDLIGLPDYTNPGHFTFPYQQTPQAAEKAASNSVMYMPKIKGFFIGTIAGGIVGAIADYSYHQMSSGPNPIVSPDIHLLNAYIQDYGNKAMDLIRGHTIAKA